MVKPDIFHLTQELVSEIKSAIVSYGLNEIPVLLESPKDKSHGDFSTPVAMLLAKKLKKVSPELGPGNSSSLQNKRKSSRRKTSGCPRFYQLQVKSQGFLFSFGILYRPRETVWPKHRTERP